MAPTSVVAVGSVSGCSRALNSASCPGGMTHIVAVVAVGVSTVAPTSRGVVVKKRAIAANTAHHRVAPMAVFLGG